MAPYFLVLADYGWGVEDLDDDYNDEEEDDDDGWGVSTDILLTTERDSKKAQVSSKTLTRGQDEARHEFSHFNAQLLLVAT